jgi:RsiW-degrading membrane proteinase PrsW (M82 family)
MRLVLIVESGTLAGRQFTLEQGVLELGRGEVCGMRFGPAETQVSRRHAVVGAIAGGFRIEDHSSNGTLINGQRAASAVLRSGDRLQLGADGPRLRVEIGSVDAQAPALAEEPTAVRARRASLAEARLYDPSADKGRQPNTLGIVLVLGMVLGGCFLGALTMLLTIGSLGLGAAIVGTIVAFLPAPVYLLVWLWLDRYDPEPAWILGGGFLWGAGVATFLAGIINTVFGVTMMSITGNPGLSRQLSASISAPIFEELLKGLAVLAIFLFFRREFDGILDGIVYAGVVALGFATVENVLYYGGSLAKNGFGMLVVTFFVRGILAPFSHAVFTSMTGIGCGIARQTHNTALRLIMPVAGYLGAIALHFLWNTIFIFAGQFTGFLLIYAVVWAPLFLIFFAFVIYMGFRESRLIKHMLELEVARGLLKPEHVAIVGSWLRRIGWLMGDMSRFGARRHFLHAATRLALCYWHASRAAAAGGQTVSFSQIPVFQKEIQRLLPAI